MRCRLFSLERDYREVSSWWEAREGTFLHASKIPELGLVVESDAGIRLASGFIYTTGTAFTIFSWVAVNPALDKETRREALEKLISEAEEVVKDLYGSTTLIAMTSKSSLATKFVTAGYTYTETVLHLMKDLNV